MKTIAHLYLEKYEKLSEREKEILLQAIKLESEPIYSCSNGTIDLSDVSFGSKGGGTIILRAKNEKNATSQRD